MSDHIADQAGFLASLPRDDPERRLAEEHARACSPCRTAFEEGESLIALLRAAPLLPAPTPEVLEHAARVIASESARHQRTARLFDAAVAGAVVIAWLLQVANGYGRLARDVGSVVVSLVTLAVAVIGVTFVRARQSLVLATMIGASCLLVFSASASPDLHAKYGIECTFYELVAGMIPWLAAVVVVKRKGFSVNPRGKMGIVAAGALASQSAQHLTCPVAHATSHLLVFHLGGVILAGLLGAVLPGLPVEIAA